MSRKRVHRVAISNPDKEDRIEGMITGSSVLQALRENLPVLGALGGTPVGNLFPTGADQVITASAISTTARECANSLLGANVLGMPLVDADGAIVTNFSLSDITAVAGLTPEDASAALDQAAITLVKGDAPHARAAVCVTMSDSLATAIELIVSAKVRRHACVCVLLLLCL